MDNLLITKDVARELHCSPRMVVKLVQTQQLRAKKLGAEYRFEPEDVRTYRKHLPVVGVPRDLRKRPLGIPGLLQAIK